MSHKSSFIIIDSDDVTLLHRGKADLRNALTEIAVFKKVSGLDLNRKASMCTWVGKSMDRNEREEA